MDKLWAPWRLEYVAIARQPVVVRFCDEAAGALGDASPRRARRARVRAAEQFPYASGHVMVATKRHAGELGDLEPDEAAEIHRLTIRAIDALRLLYRPDAFNVGWNLGEVPAARSRGTCHQHVVPRWGGDTNFMPVLGREGAPRAPPATRDRLRDALDG